MDIASIAQAQSGATAAGTRIAGDFNTFLTLLTAQLRNQDPLDPLDTDKFVSQLVEFSSVEQSIQTNRNLEALIALQSGAATSNALALLGQTVVFAGDRAIVKNGIAEWRYAVPAGASAVSLSILDSEGRVVSQTAGATAAGEHAFVFADGAEGATYRLAVAAVDRSGANLTAPARSLAPVTSVSLGTGAPVLTTPLGDVALASVTRVISRQ